jgi:hypothetical protein
MIVFFLHGSCEKLKEVKEKNNQTQLSQMFEFDLLLSSGLLRGLSGLFSNAAGNVF